MTKVSLVVLSHPGSRVIGYYYCLYYWFASHKRYGAFILTGLTLFFVELLPKSLGVVNAEMVARVMVPPINMLSTVVSPLGITLGWLSKKTLYMLGVRELSNKSGVSDSQLRLIVTGALDSGTIDHGEREMIQGVLNLQDQRIKEIMRPRVEMIAVPTTMSVASVLAVVRASGYSRIPVYEGEIDNIVGIVLAKSVLDFFVHGVLIDKDNPFTLKGKGAATAPAPAAENEQETDSDATTTAVTSKGEDDHYSTAPIQIDHKDDNSASNDRYVRTLTATELAARMEMSVKEADLIETCYFVPDTANGWSVLQEMRRRRVHMAIVVVRKIYPVSIERRY